MILALCGAALLGGAGLAGRAVVAASTVGTVNAQAEAEGLAVRVSLWVAQDEVPAARAAAARALARFAEAVRVARAPIGGPAELEAVASRWSAASGGAWEPGALALYRRWADGGAIQHDPAERGYGLVGVGWALDCAAAGLAAEGFDHHWLESEGCRVVAGSRGGRPWRLALEDPSGGVFAVGEQPPGACVRLDRALRPHALDGCLLAAVLDPRSGQPARDFALAVVFAPSAAEAAALAMALPVLGAEVGLRLVAEARRASAALVGRDGGIATSPGLTIHGGRFAWKS